MATVFCFEFWFGLLLLTANISAIPEEGKWTFRLKQDTQFAAVAKHMFSGSKVTVSVSLGCNSSEVTDIEIAWLLRLSPCAMEYDFISDTNKEMLENLMKAPIAYLHMRQDVELMTGKQMQECWERDFQLAGDPDQKPILWKAPPMTENHQAAASPMKSSSSEQQEQKLDTALSESSAQDTAGRQKREDGQDHDSDRSSTATTSPKPPPKEQGKEGPQAQAPMMRESFEKGESQTYGTPSTTPAFDGLGNNSALGMIPPKIANIFQKPGKSHHEPFLKTWTDGNYLFVIHFKPPNPEANFTAEVTIHMFYGDYNYISALDYPLLVFYGVMGLVYILYGVVWLLMLACNWRDLLRVQFWIGGLILLGMLEKAVFFAEYENINKTGVSGSVTLVFAELVSCLKRTLARMLVIIVSLGFGIVKPRLGQTFHKVMLVGGLFFIFSAIEGFMRATSPTVIQSNQFLMAAVPLAVLDAIICWWIFSSLIQTTRTLRLRRNIIKLSLYRHFTNALIFNVLASVAYMVWFLTQHKLRDCIKDWRQLWVDEAFWHVLFVVLLLIIIILWRPTVNNQRYAYSPLLDNAEEDDEEDGLENNAFADGMKMRGAKNGSTKQQDPKNKMEEDLKWVEENIPSSMADKALPTILDSDEELMTTKLEMSKME